MKVGMLFECGPKGADRKVCEYLARLLRPDIEIISKTLDNKPNLIAECGTFAAQLLKDGCERIVIVWDLYPAWREKGQNPCRKEDRDAINRSLAEANVTSSKVYLVCIEEELEAWLISDKRALLTVLPKIKPEKIKEQKKPEQVSNPKMFLNKLFQEAGQGRYVDYLHAEKIVKAMPDLKRLQKRCASFARFAFKLED